ncbi:MAG: ABC transporter ATP-binding protein [Candidatus Brockarchaeota archaeon]|nr:ABC transporter ATP-binding protein [Candidatus Brockarchaeota archaeon]
MKILEAVNVYKYFPIDIFGRKKIRAVDGISLHVASSETLAIVGESGSGKTTLGRILSGLVKPDKGKILYKGSSFNGFHGKVQMVFQNPDSSLDPSWQTYDIVSEAMNNRRKSLDSVAEVLELVGLNPAYITKYPHELSGGEKQRVAIARAIAAEPEIIILDEPVSALDASIRAQILNLLLDLQEKKGYTYVLIDHDLGVVAQIADRVVVMYAGKVVEEGKTEEVFQDPKHPYTIMLLSASTSNIPKPKINVSIQGELPSLINPPSGCRFRTRCPFAQEKCKVEEPQLYNVSREHEVACYNQF